MTKKASQKEVDLKGVPINHLVDEICARDWNVTLRRPKGWKRRQSSAGMVCVGIKARPPDNRKPHPRETEAP